MGFLFELRGMTGVQMSIEKREKREKVSDYMIKCTHFSPLFYPQNDGMGVDGWTLVMGPKKG